MKVNACLDGKKVENLPAKPRHPFGGRSNGSALRIDGRSRARKDYDCFFPPGRSEDQSEPAGQPLHGGFGTADGHGPAPFSHSENL